MPSYLDDTYLGQAEDDATTEVGSADNLPALRQDNLPSVPEFITLPGGITMPRKTALILLAVAIAIAIWVYTRSRKKGSDA
jgi:hypothetical protein